MRSYLLSVISGRKKGLIAGAIILLLWPLSFIYGLLTMALALRRKESFSCKVVSVGNITLGGTGKTSLVEYIACFLKSLGRNTAIVSRGYKREVFSEGQPLDYAAMGDEPLMLSQKLPGVPVIVDKDRHQGIKRAISKLGVDTVILDDAMQQWGIRKDLEIVAIDAGCPFGPKMMLPAGILREPLSALKRADILALNKVDLDKDGRQLQLLAGINPDALVIETVHEPVDFYSLNATQDSMELEQLKGKNVCLFCAIGEPGSFTRLITNLGIRIAVSFKFPDHHGYRKRDLDRIYKKAQNSLATHIITTQKDAVRIDKRQLADYQLPILALRIKLAVIKNEKEFQDRLSGLYRI